MNSLWLEACLGSFYVAVTSESGTNGFTLNSAFDANPRNANKLISESVNHLLESGGLESKSIDCIYLSKGPGSFTGIKLAAAFALGFSFAHPRKIPIQSYNALQCLSKMLSKNLILKSTSKTGFYSDGVNTKNINGSEISKADDVSFWGEWVGFSDEEKADLFPLNEKQNTFDQLIEFIKNNKDLTESFQSANYLKEPEIHSKGAK